MNFLIHLNEQTIRGRILNINNDNSAIYLAVERRATIKISFTPSPNFYRSEAIYVVRELDLYLWFF